MSDSGEKQPNLGDYFIPNLCRGHGLPEMLVAAGLIGLLITLIHSGISSFDRVFFTQLALYTMSGASFPYPPIVASGGIN
jgi:two-component system sensor histidine kinase AlgZ